MPGQSSPPPIVTPSTSRSHERELIEVGRDGLFFFPDEPVCPLDPDHNGTSRWLVVAKERTHMLIGAELCSAREDRLVLGYGPDGEYDSGYAGITSVHRGGGQLYAFYHAERHLAPQGSSGGKPGYFSCALAVSAGSGRQFRRVDQILTCPAGDWLPMGGSPAGGQPHQGVGDLHVVPVPGADGTLLHAYFTDLSREVDGTSQICVARCDPSQVSDPGAWRKWHSGGWGERGRGGHATPVVPKPSHVNYCDLSQPHVTALADDLFLMFCCVLDNQEAADWIAGKFVSLRNSGLAVCASRNGQDWSVPTVFRVGMPIPFRGHGFAAHPSLLCHQLIGRRNVWSIDVVFCRSEVWSDTVKPGAGPHGMAIIENLEVSIS